MWMKKFLALVSVIFVFGMGLGIYSGMKEQERGDVLTHEEHQAMYEEDMKEEKVIEKPKKVDFEGFSYEITGENENELYGVAIDSHGKEIGGGLVLNKSLLKETYNIGDVVNVTFAGADDNISKIEMMVKAEDGTYVPQSFYNDFNESSKNINK
jgi:hypothetical protein